MMSAAGGRSGDIGANCPLRNAEAKTDGASQCIRFHEPRQRIIYSLNESQWFSPLIAHEQKDGTFEMLLARIPAEPLTNEDREDRDASALKDPLCALKGRVVFIGGSFAEARDIHQTPLGRMPGVLIMINSLTSLLEHGDLSPNPWLEALFLVLLVLGASVAFAWCEPTLLAALIVVSFVLLIVLGLGLCCVGLVTAGLDFGLPLLAITVHQVILDLWEAFGLHRRT